MSDTSDMNIRVETITPEIARQYLDMNKENRPVRRMRVDSYAQQMARGQWLPTGDPIRFNSEGRLLDGQHRLHAVIQANATLDMIVIRDVPTAAFKVLDSGYARTVGNAIGFNLKNSTTMVAASRLLWVIEVGGDPRRQVDMLTPSRVDLADYYLSHEKEMTASVHFAQQMTTMFSNGTNKSAWSAFMQLAWRINEDWAYEFHSRVHTGLDLGLGDARYVLRNLLIRGEIGDRRASQHLGLIIKTWNDWMSCRRRQLLAFRATEPWPELVTERKFGALEEG